MFRALIVLEKTVRTRYFLKIHLNLMFARARRGNLSKRMTKMDNSLLRRRQVIVLWCGVVLSFFTSMSKILVPGPIIDDLQALGFNAVELSAMAFSYFCTYAVSQLALGAFSVRYGGVRLMLFGGGCFVLGSVLFPLGSLFPPGWAYWVMFAARMLTGLGAGTMFPGLAKLLSDLYTGRFALVFSVVMFLGYLGPICGREPVLMLVRLVRWRWALEILALSSLAVFAILVIAARGAVKPVMPGHSLEALGRVFGNGRNLLIFLASSVIYGAFYVLPAMVGQKCLTDSGMSKVGAERLMMAQGVMIALFNLGTVMLLKLFGGYRKLLFLFSILCGLSGSILGVAAFQLGLPLSTVVAAFFLVATPACFFSLQSLIVKEMNPPEIAGLSISMLNFSAFVLIAACQPVAGVLLHRYEAAAKRTADVISYPPEAYRDIFIFFVVLEAIGFVCALFVPETKPKKAPDA